MRMDDDLNGPVDTLLRAPAFRQLLEELKSGLVSYWTAAEQILRPCGVCLKPPDEVAFSLSKNFFSLLFLYSYRRAGIAAPRRRLYAATLQCLRGMVTGCDNLLDDEYKPTLETDIPADGYRFRSVVDIMVSDRVLFQVLMEAARRGAFSVDRALAASTASMRTMTRSGVQEAGEEAGIVVILEPETILQSIHHFKTGILFQCPWDIPRTIETVAEAVLEPLLEGLYRIGIGCQIMDDIVDLGDDICARKHNYLVSLIHHGADPVECARLARAMHPEGREDPESMHSSGYPQAMRRAWETAHRMLTQGLSALFDSEDRGLVQPAMRFLEKRIGVVAPPSGAGP